jgi:ribosomal protein S18 acetylase RimI-like enzyme
VTLPNIHTLYGVIDATWPAAKLTQFGGITLRQGDGGGSRVSAATCDGELTTSTLSDTEQAMRDMDQPALFMVRDGQSAADDYLAAQGYTVMDPCNVYAAPLSLLTGLDHPHKTCFAAFPPLASQREVWAKGGIGDSRIAVMQRATGPKTTFLGRAQDRPAGTVYAAIHDGCAMLHALEIDAQFRRHGLGRHLTIAIAKWAQAQGAAHLSLITTQANAGANALYASLGMEVVGHYHYRIKTKG